MPEYQQAEQLQGFVDEVFEISKTVWAAQSQAKATHESDISETEFLALDFIARSQGGVCVGDIQRYIGVLPAQMSRIVRTLEQKADGSMIRCSINKSDKRKIDVELTPAGQEAWRAYREMKLGSIQKMLQALPDDDRAEFMRIIRKMMGQMRKSMTSK